MSPIWVAGAGAFGTAMAVALAVDARPVRLWARDGAALAAAARSRHLPGLPQATLPDSVVLSPDLAPEADAAVLLAIPTQALRAFLDAHAGALAGCRLVSCAKGLETGTGLRPTEIVAAALPGMAAAVLTGPSFAADIARGLPTALTLADADAARAAALQDRLTTPALRLYRSTDLVGAELGGALKNVVAIAAGVVIGAGLGQSARAALIARGYAEMSRLALALGARAETLGGLSGLGDLVLTCTSDQSRNFAYGRALGSAALPPAQTTVEGRATAGAVAALAARSGVEMPIGAMVADLIAGRTDLRGAIAALMARPLKVED
jgi:glycerol-3-phosphate dehydrogenase (NAD(P)+)